MDGSGQIPIFSLISGLTPNLDGHITAKKIPLKVSDYFISMILETAMVSGKITNSYFTGFLILIKNEFNSSDYIIWGLNIFVTTHSFLILQMFKP